MFFNFIGSWWLTGLLPFAVFYIAAWVCAIAWFCGEIFIIALMCYSTIHMWFSVFAYTDMIVKTCN